MDTWKFLFEYAVTQLETAGISKEQWTFGGGTVLMHEFNHRMSKDIDIFLADRQLLSGLSPRINDALDHIVLDYAEQSHCVRIYTAHGEIDFIQASNITTASRKYEQKHHISCYVENPIEIVAKKIAYRGVSFRVRDIFDLALVYSERKSDFVKHAFEVKPYIEVLTRRLDSLSPELIAKNLAEIDRLPGSCGVEGRELALCKEFIELMKTT